MLPNWSFFRLCWCIHPPSKVWKLPGTILVLFFIVLFLCVITSLSMWKNLIRKKKKELISEALSQHMHFCFCFLGPFVCLFQDQSVLNVLDLIPHPRASSFLSKLQREKAPQVGSPALALQVLDIYFIFTVGIISLWFIFTVGIPSFGLPTRM